MLLEDGTTYGADLVVMAVGIRPETRLANDAALEVGRGITVNDAMLTSDPAILAVGECVEHDGNVYGLVAPLYQMARVMAERLLAQPGQQDLPGQPGQPGKGFVHSDTPTKLKVTGVDVYSVGDFADDLWAGDSAAVDANLVGTDVLQSSNVFS